MYIKIGGINNFSEIPWGKEIIITGSTGNDSWVQRMKGVFKKDSNGYRFENEFGMSTHFEPSSFVSLNVLEKVTATPASRKGAKKHEADN